MHTPQIFAIVIVSASVAAAVAKHGEARPPWNGGDTIVAAMLWCGLLWWGGFFG